MKREQLYAGFLADLQKIKKAIGTKAHEQSSELSMAQSMILHLVKCQENPTMSVLTKKLGTTPSATVQHIAALTEGGWIKKTTDPHDARKQILSLTDTGEQLYLRLKKQRAEAFASVFSALTDDEFKTLQNLIHKTASDITIYE